MNTAVPDPIWSTFISIFAVQLPWKRWRKNASTKLSSLTPPVATRQSSPWRYYEHTPGGLKMKEIRLSYLNMYNNF